MKKIVVLVLLLSVLFSLSACKSLGSGSTISDDLPNNNNGQNNIGKTSSTAATSSSKMTSSKTSSTKATSSKSTSSKTTSTKQTSSKAPSHYYVGEFVPGDVIVTINKDNTKIGKTFTAADFKDIGALSVENLNGYSDAKKIPGYKDGTYRNILLIHLKDKTKDAVWKAIDLLEARKDIESASPNGIMHKN